MIRIINIAIVRLVFDLIVSVNQFKNKKENLSNILDKSYKKNYHSGCISSGTQEYSIIKFSTLSAYLS